MKVPFKERILKVKSYYDNKCGYSKEFCENWRARVDTMSYRQVAAVYERMYGQEDINKKGGIKGQIDIWDYLDYIHGKEQCDGCKKCTSKEIPQVSQI